MNTLLDLLEVVLVLTALYITNTPSIKNIIMAYRIQSLLLAGVAVLTAWDKQQADVGILIFLIALLPLFLMVGIKPLMARATLTAEEPLRVTIAWMFRRLSRWGRPRQYAERSRKMEHDAEREWLRVTMTRSQARLAVSVVLILGAFLVAFEILPGDTKTFSESERIGLAVSMSLHLLGIYNMVHKLDIVSQVIGLLVMDHGLYLAVVKIVEIPVPAQLFVISLYFYTVITIFILTVLIPQIRQVTGSLELTAIKRDSMLKG